ncbi:CDP-alcohol phosphatidyltransferase family protein [Luteimonas sp. SX5]|uniref:CDP-alcohol phosphatidyltransferase family protein n=1 Tax=Luteimonas galliterrae TaxID=2940486 RepID=A0ABT0MKE2_9GAMM|nr:CDP-alcohol phosphatidyltransferase family protein [Luteimonas galliterrae]MCL1635354.1 CDP-alcohol phosphatidyltransferase family protein [Luteimonas galliterrae]
MNESRNSDPQSIAHDSRRPIAARGSAFARHSAAWLAKSGITPNAISVLSIVFAAAGAAALLWLTTPWGALLCAAGIQARLLCNLFDGMVAVEGGKASATGTLYNEVPDRIADSALLIALGYAAGIGWLGWLAALLAALTAYVRTLGGALGQAQDFRGPMAKQHRMALMTLACLIAPIELALSGSRYALLIAAATIAAGSALTCWTRLRAIGKRMATQA